ncbi:MAG: M20/M25/M40 family metallo-hydrolase [Phycisphaerae bacterium]|nr:M20/M25/M40 family metallo-hydrolase [Phycisphaerae bacterium]
MSRSLLIAGALLVAGCSATQPPSTLLTLPGPIATQYAPVAQRIIDAALKRNDAYAKLSYLCDHIGHRLSGSPQLERAIAWTQDAMKRDGHDNVRAEPVQVARWVRGRESLTLIEPRDHDVAMLGLGGSIGTPPEGLTAEVEVVADEAALDALGDRARGKIILFNNPMPPYDPEHGAYYGSSVRFRHKGARIAAEKGAVACLVRSVTAHSLRSPHTGAMSYKDAPRKIPAAAVSIEDAMMIARLRGQGVRVVARLSMEARDEGMVPSANVVGELRGREKPDEIVLIGGHLDSWDVGHGAHDDGAGCVMAMEAISVLRRLNLIPRRTIRVVLFTNEENGLAGGKSYAETHAPELHKHVAAIEADSGGFAPRGFGYEINDPDMQAVAVRQMADLARLFAPLDATTMSPGGGGADISPMKPANVPLLGLDVEGTHYFDYHHSHADTLDKVRPDELSQCVAAMAVMSYVLADMPGRLGHVGP